MATKKPRTPKKPAPRPPKTPPLREPMPFGLFARRPWPTNLILKKEGRP